MAKQHKTKRVSVTQVPCKTHDTIMREARRHGHTDQSSAMRWALIRMAEILTGKGDHGQMR